MANAYITYKNGSTTKKYIISGLLNLREKKTQQSVELPFPFKADNANVINSIFGQVRTFAGSFLVLQRSDDYTNGTAIYSTGTPDEQKNYLMDTIFNPLGYHILTDELGNTYNGRIEELEVLKSGDDPVKMDCTFSFKRGIVPVAGQFSPFS
jgi:hypothetical protein